MKSSNKIYASIILIVFVVGYYVMNKYRTNKESQNMSSFTDSDEGGIKPFNETIPMQVKEASNIGQLTIGNNGN